ncbi:MAG: radical SAM/SPASM domain-containing protein [Candidatus Bathyarchaeia archaeon]
MAPIDRGVETFRVGLLITERCNVACSHCWFSSGPDKTARMKLGEARGYIDQAVEIPTMEWISFTGGEPLLLPEMLLRLVGYASGRGLHTECVTNCFWAATKGEAEARLRGLADAGLDVVNISVDDFHQSHIPFERVRHCYNAAKLLGLKVVIMCAVARSSKLNVEEVARLLGDDGIRIVGRGAANGEASALAVETGFIPVGRGAEIPESEWAIDSGPIDGPCNAVLRDVAIAPSGRVLPCCSAAALAEAAAVGNVRRYRLRRLIEEAGRRPLFRALSKEGPLGLQRRIGTMRRGRYVNRCHLCYEVLTDPRIGEAL